MQTSSLGEGATAASRALAVALAFAPAAAAQHAHPIAQGLLGLPANDAGPASHRYVTPDGTIRFVFDRSPQGSALVRFDGAPEVILVRPIPGPRGDEIFKTQQGETILRVTSLGGVIVYRDAAKMGAPAARVAPAPPLAAAAGR
jgi:hypothetical protein